MANKKQEEEQIRTLSQILQKKFPILKATTIGIIIDVSSIYRNEKRNVYMRRIKLIDHTFNFNKYNPFIFGKYLTVYFQSDFPANLPRPRFIGDILYLKRFKFTLHNQQLQAFQYNKYNYNQFCAWYLISGDIKQYNLQIYGTTRADYNMKNYQSVLNAVKQLKHFSEEYQSNQSIMSLHPQKFKSQDNDYIVKVVNRSAEGYFLDLKDDQVFLPYIQSQVSVNSLAKLTNVVRIENKNGLNQVICNKFTSLVALYDWSYEARMSENIKPGQDQEKQVLYTKLAPLMSINLLKNHSNYFHVKVEIAEMLPASFLQALDFCLKQSFDENSQEEKESRDYQALHELVYNIKFICMDQDFYNTYQFFQIFLYSENQIGANLVQRINLQQISPFSSYVQEEILYKQKREQLLSSKAVKMKIEVLEDKNKNRIFRLIDIYKIL